MSVKYSEFLLQKILFKVHLKAITVTLDRNLPDLHLDLNHDHDLILSKKVEIIITKFVNIFVQVSSFPITTVKVSSICSIPLTWITSKSDQCGVSEVGQVTLSNVAATLGAFSAQSGRSESRPAAGAAQLHLSPRVSQIFERLCSSSS